MKNNSMDNKQIKPVTKGKHRAMAEAIPAGASARYLSFLREVAPPVNYDRNNNEMLDKQAERYFELSQKYDLKVGNMQFYFAIGVDHRDITYLLSKENHLSDVIKRGQAMCRAMRELYTQNGDIPFQLGIFWNKAIDGLQETTTVEIRQTVDDIPAEKLIETVKDLPISGEL